jgi:hypothetical protein
MALLCNGRGRSRHRFANGHLRRTWRSPFDSSNDNDRPVVGANRGHGYKPVLTPQMIDQSAFPRVQHLLWKGEEISESPYQICALQEIRLYISRPDRRVQFKNAIGEFFNPHDLGLPKNKPFTLTSERGHYCTTHEALGSNLFILWTNYLRLSNQFEKKGHGTQTQPTNFSANFR